MLIETEATPNPATLKFLPGREVLAGRTADFADADAALVSPLAEGLFGVAGVRRVFLGGDFVTVTKDEVQEWSAVRPAVMGVIMQFFLSGAPVLNGLAGAAAPEDVRPEDAEIVTQIKDLLEERVRPAVAGDGGDIIFRGFRDGVVSLTMQGSCAGCPSSTATLKHGIENLLKHYIPEVHSVVQAA